MFFVTSFIGPEAQMTSSITLIGTTIDLGGVVVIVVGISLATARFIMLRGEGPTYELYKTRIGQSLLLGLELLVAADIVKTIAVEPSFMSLGVLAGLVLVRTFLGWTIAVEVEGGWPWQQPTEGKATSMAAPTHRKNEIWSAHQTAAKGR
jgi:uncharacterized membrane protein